MSGAGERDAGLASGVFNTTQQIGMALGVATLSTLAAARTHALTASGGSRTSALTGGYHVAFAAGAGLLLLALVVAFVALRRPGATTEPALEPIPAPEPAPEPTTAARQPVS